MMAKVYAPAATTGDVMCRVVEAVAPGSGVRLEAPKVFDQPVLDGVAWSAKLVAVQAGGVGIGDGDGIGHGRAGGDGGALGGRGGDARGPSGCRGSEGSRSTRIVAVVLVTESVVMVRPETGSVKLLPTSRNASSGEGRGVGGHVEEVLLSGCVSEARWMKTPVRYRLASQPRGRRSSTKNDCPVVPRAIFRALGAVPGIS